jgi:hypothetical protein
MSSIRKPALLGAAVVMGAGCVREPVERLCPEVAEGALVVSELRIAPSRAGDSATWIELYNASEAELDLLGVGVRVRRLDGGAEQRLLVRRELVVPAGGLAVLSQMPDDARPAYADYGFGAEAPGPFYATGALAVESCEGVVDRMTYGKQPAEASYAFGAWPPSASGNDEAAAWCADGDRAGEDEGEPATPGTPRERNPPCRR